jgi:hypothetical protein
VSGVQFPPWPETELIIKKTYRTLTTRGKNDYYGYSTDKALEGDFRDPQTGHVGMDLTKVAELDVIRSDKPSGRDL